VVEVTFAKAFRRHVECPAHQVEGGTVGSVLRAYFSSYPEVRGYVLDERGRLRRHVTVFVGDQQVNHTEALDHSVSAGDTVYLFQALSGG
jgi:molybdopterin converting factor small subunit